MPDAIVGAGTVLTAADLAAVEAAGAAFAFAPGATRRLRGRAHRGVPLLPGIATASELMAGLELGHTRLSSSRPKQPAA